eukprot:CAMPEP_0168386954 /NCGR_PEP_ID=MMETSP0228-20121227/15696_1 /TAXON_ID=133427 /ORGANISM="Protoceratium reticulatum, Strain CCCM 535 (=CCMP 1889)" /LENGTH=544 /DNA_ID=CAMNT_0008400175 /DNA_START=210 /DNA_END=1841 /DNA_ORIENTATION=-
MRIQPASVLAVACRHRNQNRHDLWVGRALRRSPALLSHVRGKGRLALEAQIPAGQGCMQLAHALDPQVVHAVPDSQHQVRGQRLHGAFAVDGAADAPRQDLQGWPRAAAYEATRADRSAHSLQLCAVLVELHERPLVDHGLAGRLVRAGEGVGDHHRGGAEREGLQRLAGIADAGSGNDRRVVVQAHVLGDIEECARICPADAVAQRIRRESGAARAARAQRRAERLEANITKAARHRTKHPERDANITEAAGHKTKRPELGANITKVTSRPRDKTKQSELEENLTKVTSRPRHKTKRSELEGNLTKVTPRPRHKTKRSELEGNITKVTPRPRHKTKHSEMEANLTKARPRRRAGRLGRRPRAGEELDPELGNWNVTEELQGRNISQVRVAVCLAGETRTFSSQAVQESFMERFHFPGYDYFLSVDSKVKDNTTLFWNQIRAVSIAKPVEFPGSYDCPSTSPMHRRLYSMADRMQQCYSDILKEEERGGFTYDFVIRTRPDIWFKSKIPHATTLRTWSKHRDVLVCDDMFAFAPRQRASTILVN